MTEARMKAEPPRSAATYTIEDVKRAFEDSWRLRGSYKDGVPLRLNVAWADYERELCSRKAEEKKQPLPDALERHLATLDTTWLDQFPAWQREHDRLMLEEMRGMLEKICVKFVVQDPYDVEEIESRILAKVARAAREVSRVEVVRDGPIKVSFLADTIKAVGEEFADIVEGKQ